MALAMTGQPWTDNRISFQEFSALKPSKLEFVCFDLLRVKPCRVFVPQQANGLDTTTAAAAAVAEQDVELNLPCITLPATSIKHPTEQLSLLVI